MNIQTIEQQDQIIQQNKEKIKSLRAQAEQMMMYQQEYMQKVVEPNICNFKEKVDQTFKQQDISLSRQAQKQQIPDKQQEVQQLVDDLEIGYMQNNAIAQKISNLKQISDDYQQKIEEQLRLVQQLKLK